MPINVLFLNRHSDELIDYLNNGLEGFPVNLQLPPNDDRESLIKLVPDADVLIGWGSDMDLLECATNLKLFINPGTGIRQHIENFRRLSTHRDALLINGHGNSYAVAQHTVALLMALSNKVIPHHTRMEQNIRLPQPHRTTYFKNKVIGFLGYGAINSKVHRFLSGFELNFAVYRRKRLEGDKYPTLVKQYAGDQLNDFFEASDVVINALPATSYTDNLVTMEQLIKLGCDALFVTVGRASTVVEEDLFNALREGIIAGAALDVWWGRKGPKPEQGRHDPYRHPFHELDNVVMSPHRAADCGGDLDRWEEVIENLKRLSSGRSDFLNVIDLDLEY